MPSQDESQIPIDFLSKMETIFLNPSWKPYQELSLEFWKHYFKLFKNSNPIVEVSIQEVPSFSMVHHRKHGWLSSSQNQVESYNNPIYHSEILTMKEALDKISSRYLTECTLFTVLEPCYHCASSILKYRLERVVYFAPAMRGQGITSYSFEMIYQAYHFPVLVYIPLMENGEEFHKFFQKIREKSNSF